MSGVAIASVVASTAVSLYNANRQEKAQNRANRIQEQASQRAAAQQTMQMRRQNQQQADTTSVLEGNTGADTSATMLTGAGGVNPGMMHLGQGSTLLGG